MRNLACTRKSPFIAPRLTEHSNTMEQKIYQTGENVFCAVGYGLSYPVMIVGEDGIIILDPGETIAMMETIMAEFRTITDKPVRAVILSHCHGDHWGGMSVCVTEEQSRSREVQVIVDETFLPNFSQASGELLDIRMGRAVWMYGSVLPIGEHGYVNLGCGPILSKGMNRFIEPNTFVPKKDGLHTAIAGVELELFHCEAETEDAICVFLPKEKIMFVGDAIQGEIFPNLYTIRGTVRDAKKWYRGIDLIRSYHPHYLVGTHMRPLHGVEACTSLLTDYRDAIQYTHDQAVRVMNQGVTAASAVTELGQLPPHLFQRERLGEFYGTFKQGIRGVYDSYLGWFSGEPSQLDPIPSRLSAKRHIDLMGGREAVLAAAEQAISEEEYAWAAELLCYPLRVNPKDKKALRLKGKAVSQLGYLTENATWRNWYLTCAMAYEGAFEQIVERVGPNAGFPPASNSFLGLSNTEMFEALKVKLNGPKSADKHLLLKATIADQAETFWLELRRGVLEVHMHRPEHHLTSFLELSADKSVWAKLATREQTVEEAISQGAQCSDITGTRQFFGCFEHFTPFVSMPFCYE